MSYDIEEIRSTYKDLFEYSLDLIFVNKLNGDFLDANNNLLKIFGLKREDIPHYSLSDIMDKDQLAKAYKSLTELKKTGRQSNMMELRINGKDGITIYVDAYVIPLYKNGKIYATLGIARNITDLRRAQSRIERSEEKYRFLYETTPYSIILLNSEGIIVDCNPTTELMFGYIKDELVGRAFKNISAIHQKYIPMLIKLFQKHVEGEDITPIDIQLYKKDGKLMWVNAQASIVDLSGNLFVQVTFQDITDKKVISQKLEESEEQYRDLYQNALACLWTIRIQDTKIIRANNVSTEFTGINSLEELIDKYYVSDFFEPDVIKDIYKKLKISGEISGLETRFKDVMGNEKTLSVWAKLYYDKGIIEGAFIDITYLKIVQKALRESEENFRTITEQSFIGIIIIQNGVIIYTNEIVSKIMGYSFQELKNWSTNDFFKKIHPDDIPIAAKRFQTMQMGDIDAFPPYPYRVFSKSGKIKWIEVYSKIIHYQGKNAIMATIVDVTNKKDAEEKVKESEEKYRHLFENSPNMIILLDSNGRILDANTPFLSVFNYKEDEIIGKNFQQLENVSLEASSVYKKRFKEIFDNGILEPFELQAAVKGDFLRWMSIQSSLIDIDGKKLLQVIFQDINDRKEAEQRLRESEQKYRIISENANDLITVINEKFRFEYINEEVHKRITGYSKEDLIGKSPLDNFYPEDIQKTVETWRDGVLSGEGTTEFRYKKKDGTLIWLDMRGKKFIDTNGEPKGIIISRDITKRKIAEQKLKESEQKYRHLFESSPYSIGLLDLEGTLIEGNEATNKFLSTGTKDELIGKNIKEIFSSSEQDKLLLPKLTEYVKEVIKNEVREPLELPITRSIGDVMWISFYGSLIKIGDKSFLQFLGQDITDRKRAEQDLKKSEERYRHLFESSPYFIGLLDKDGILLDCNNAVYEFLSIHTKDDVLGTNINDMLALNKNNEPLIPLFQENFKRLLRGEVVESFECQLYRSIGDFLWMSVHGSLLKIEDSLLILFIIQDITEKKKAEQELKKSEEKYRLLFENSPNAIILANSKGIILDFNQVTEKLLGFKRDELIGKNYTKISAPAHVKLMRKRYEDHLKGISLKPMEIEVRNLDGSYIWVNYQNKIIKFDDEDISIAIIQDITKRKEAELIVKEELIKLKELDQIRKDLISRVSHELKTPLIPVISGTELLTTIYKDQIGEDALEIIEMIDNGGVRLKNLVEKLINVSRIDYNKFEVRKETLNLSEIIKRSANGMKFLMEQRKLKLKCEIPDKLYLEMDELKMEEVITNLLSNAIKNTPPHGEINLSLRKEDNWAIIKVEDSGVGLTEKEKEVLFTRFGKIERYEKGLEDIDVKGSGLGLYICKEIISLHEGKIWAESEGRNKGASFTVKLPIK